MPMNMSQDLIVPDDYKRVDEWETNFGMKIVCYVNDRESSIQEFNGILLFHHAERFKLPSDHERQVLDDASVSHREARW